MLEVKDIKDLIQGQILKESLSNIRMAPKKPNFNIIDNLVKLPKDKLLHDPLRYFTFMLRSYSNRIQYTNGFFALDLYFPKFYLSKIVASEIKETENPILLRYQNKSFNEVEKGYPDLSTIFEYAFKETVFISQVYTVFPGAFDSLLLKFYALSKLNNKLPVYISILGKIYNLHYFYRVIIPMLERSDRLYFFQEDYNKHTAKIMFFSADRKGNIYDKALIMGILTEDPTTLDKPGLLLNFDEYYFEKLEYSEKLNVFESSLFNVSTNLTVAV